MLKEEKIENRRISHQDFLEIAGEILYRGKLFTFRASGTSMSPFIKNGDAVTVLRDQNPDIGDVVLLKTDEGRLYLHRVVKKAESGIVTRGDASFDEDGLTPCRNILGRVVKVSGKGYNFHLRRPIKGLISKRIIFSEGLYRYPSIMKLGKKIAKIMD
jgi:hypothetical protein